jgi:UPF0755 protein
LSRRLFVAYAICSGNEKKFKAGRYLIGPTMSIHELVRSFAMGNSESEDVEIVIPEGTNVADIALILEKAGYIEKKDFLRSEIIELEGYLFPDTYRFRNCQPPTANCQLKPQDIIQKMRDNLEIKTHELFAGRFVDEGRSGREYRTIIIASMLEKEVRTEEDMRLVAGIMEKRQELGMPLEIDATVAYGVCYAEFLVGRYCDTSLANIVDNILVDSAYNTYKRRGLPAGPISNPGLRAIKAALNPQPSDYIFYLSAKDGTTIFSRTAAEHEQARRKYLK